MPESITMPKTVLACARGMTGVRKTSGTSTELVVVVRFGLRCYIFAVRAVQDTHAGRTLEETKSWSSSTQGYPVV